MDVNKPVTIRIDGRKFDNNSQGDTLQTVKKRMKNDWSDYMNNGLELSRDEQAERVNLLLLGLASLILMNAMAVLIILFVKLSKYEDQLVMNSNLIERQTKGMRSEDPDLFLFSHYFHFDNNFGEKQNI